MTVTNKVVMSYLNLKFGTEIINEPTTFVLKSVYVKSYTHGNEARL